MIRTITKYINNKKLALKGPLGKMKDIYTLGIYHHQVAYILTKPLVQHEKHTFKKS